MRCGGFRTEFAVRESDDVGVHKRCLREARPQSAVRMEHEPTMTDAVKIDFDDDGEGRVVKGPVGRPTRVRSRKDFEKAQLPPSGLRVVDAGESPLDREERELRHALDLAAD